jgi:acetyltransferase-like isoleucine patch superfamily enzyme
MIKFILKRIKGSGFELDEKVSSLDLFKLILRYSISLLRGLVIFRKKVFVGNKVVLKKKGNLSLGKWAKLSDFVYIDALASEKVILGDGASIGPYCRIECTGTIRKIGKGLVMGKRCGIGAFSFVGAAGGIIVGDDVIMGQYISFHSENHIFDDLNIPINQQGVTNKGIEIGANCWVGSKVTFLDGTIIGTGCVIAAGAVVSGTFPNNAVIGGVPAKILKYRV